MSVNYELTHHGVKGMKWGVRKDSKRRIAEARDQRDAAVAKANTEYKKKKAKIKLDTKRKLSEINNSPERTEAGRRATIKALKTTGNVAAAAAAISAGATAAVLGMRVAAWYRDVIE